jgi:GAF domain-containing protein
LQVPYNADTAFRNIEDLQLLLDNLLTIIMESIPASRGFVFLIQRDTGALIPYSRVPFTNGADDAELIVSQTIIQTAVRQKTSIISSDALVDERFVHSRSVAALDVRSAMCAPLVNRSTVLGIVYVDSHKANSFTRRDLALSPPRAQVASRWTTPGSTTTCADSSTTRWRRWCARSRRRTSTRPVTPLA